MLFPFIFSCSFFQGRAGGFFSFFVSLYPFSYIILFFYVIKYFLPLFPFSLFNTFFTNSFIISLSNQRFSLLPFLFLPLFSLLIFFPKFLNPFLFLSSLFCPVFSSLTPLSSTLYLFIPTTPLKTLIRPFFGFLFSFSPFSALKKCLALSC